MTIVHFITHPESTEEVEKIAGPGPDILFLPMEGLPERFLGTRTP